MGPLDGSFASGAAIPIDRLSEQTFAKGLIETMLDAASQNANGQIRISAPVDHAQRQRQRHYCHGDYAQRDKHVYKGKEYCLALHHSTKLEKALVQ